MRFFVVVLACLALLTGLGYCVAHSGSRVVDFEIPKPTPGRERPQGGFYVGDFPAFEHLNPITATEYTPIGFVLRFTHDGLLRIDEDTREVGPAIAQVMSSSKDLLTHDLELREDARFSDGTKVTVEDVRFTFEVVRDKTVKRGALFGSVNKIASFRKLDETRFRIVLKERHFNGIADVGVNYRVVSRKWLLDQVAIRARQLGRSVPRGPGDTGFGALFNSIRLPGPGTGPYQIARSASGEPAWVENQELWLVRNPKSWHRAAHPLRWNLDGLGLRVSGAEPITRLRQEEKDWGMPPNAAQLLEGDEALRAKYVLHRYDASGAGQYAIAWNCERLSVGVRRAFARLFRREAIRDDLLGGNAVLIDAWARKGDPEYPLDLQPIAFDLKKARAELEALGYGAAGKALTVRIVAGDDRVNRGILEAATKAFADAGVTLKSAFLDSRALQAAIDAGEYEGSLGYWPNPQLEVDPFAYYHSSGVFNEARYRNANVDDLLARARLELDSDARAVLYHRFHAIVREEQPITLLVHPINLLLLHKRFHGVKINASGAVPASWWVEKADRIYFAERTR